MFAAVKWAPLTSRGRVSHGRGAGCWGRKGRQVGGAGSRRCGMGRKRRGVPAREAASKRPKPPRGSDGECGGGGPAGGPGIADREAGLGAGAVRR